jgi:uncharacterized integral membrane protein
MLYYSLVLLVACFFYAVIPILGAFVVRAQWRSIRHSLHNSLFLPTELCNLTDQDGPKGSCCLLGELEALEGNDVIWVRTQDHRSITVEMRNSSVYFMPSVNVKEKLYPHLLPVPLPAASLDKVSWDDVFSLSEGTKMYICGELLFQNGRNCIQSGKDNPLIVLIYNENPEFLVQRAVWCGRQSNEFWNFLTPWSVLSGILLLLILSVYLIQNSANYILQFFSISMAVLPALLFLPPGVFLFQLYKRFWDKARRYRAERDLMKLPINPKDGQVHYVPDPGNINYCRQPSGWNPDGAVHKEMIYVQQGFREKVICFPETPEHLARFCQKKSLQFEILSGAVLGCCFVINFYIVWLVFNWIL